MKVMLGTIFVAMILMIQPTFLFGNDHGANSVAANGNEEQITPHEMTIILERAYLDGEISEEKIKDQIWSMEEFWAKYDQWQLVDISQKYVVFRQDVDDISPLLKANGYFGITEDGILTIFNGKPQDYNVIQSFFQIDIGKLESTKHKELQEGIRIKTKDRYVEVLETFKNYSKQSKEAK
ncbi:intercompartmental signaling factor BofC [Cytobacillus spongiae]|jgi:forespore regulator of the sigma-K checkpoint|uniref:intercompartmental signaling factor BofC n=1 Tax=Cytobacillus spongiae TaxID=2901381 RepID=UPI001F36882E|nr:intercompartmental signaling factor BofC [Cytobacillus spongiae]UII55019.1 intercompartmental signaling factor BofC [Cytobacillus spongiae]